MIPKVRQISSICKQLPSTWMGILNTTPDSFSDGGVYTSPERAVDRAQTLLAMGAHILDVGGVSTRPGSSPVSPNEELARVLPVARALRKELPFAYISLDSYQPNVVYTLAREGLIDLVNDVYAGRVEDTVECERHTTISLAARFGLGIILMHMQGEPGTMQNAPNYKDCVQEVFDFLAERARIARACGVEFIAVDPGIGFGKRLEDNLALLSASGMNLLTKLNYPLVIGLSRKRFIKELYPSYEQDLSVPVNRDLPTKELERRAIILGANIIRSHRMPDEVQS
jgi:dihydropteroate synthase